MAAMPNITVELSEEAVQKLSKIREASTSTAESALAAVYAAIEKHSQYPNGDTDLQGLAALVTALKPRQLFATSGMVHISGALGLIKGAADLTKTKPVMPQYTEM